MEIKRVEAIVEALLFTMGEAVELDSLAKCVNHDKDTVRKIVYNMMAKYDNEDRGIQIVELEDSFQMCSKPGMYEAIIKLINVPKKNVLTEVLLETLSIIAYKQPVTKTEIEAIRGVSCDHSVNKLIEYNLVCELGRMDAPGRPILFGTSHEFLRHFGLESLEGLPTIEEEQITSFKDQVKDHVVKEYPDEFGEGSDFNEEDLEVPDPANPAKGKAEERSADQDIIGQDIEDEEVITDSIQIRLDL